MNKEWVLEINNCIRTKKYDGLIVFVEELENILKKKTITEKITFLKELPLSSDILIKLFVTISTLKDNRISETFKTEIVPYCFEIYTKEHQKEISELIKKDEELELIYATWLKKYSYLWDECDNFYKELFSMSKVQELILKDEELVSKRFSTTYKFFNYLPPSFGYLISLYEVRQNDIEDLTSLYKKYFTDDLTESEQLQFIKIQTKISNSPNLLDISMKDRVAPLEALLKSINKGVMSYQSVNDLCQKTGLEPKIIIWFLYKYYHTPIYQQLCSMESITSDVIEKIKYLSKENPIENITEIDNINTITIEELEKIPKTINTDIKSNLIVGPQSKTRKNIFKDSSSREIRRISRDGKSEILKLSIYENHEDGVKKIYERDMIFPKDCKVVTERALEVAKQLSAITFVIEHEMCIIYTPSDISDAQKEVAVCWLQDAIEDGMIGIITYIKDVNDIVLAHDGDTLNSEEAIEYLHNMNKNIHIKK